VNGFGAPPLAAPEHLREARTVPNSDRSIESHMVILNKVVEEIGEKLKKTPGFGYVTTLASAFLGIVLNSEAPESSWSLSLWSLSISLLAYWVGGLLDGLLFDPIYGPPSVEKPSNAFGRFVQRWFFQPIQWLAHKVPPAAKMREQRAKAAERFHPTNQRGIYGTAKKLLSNTELWDGLIKLCLDLSKAIRTLIIPAVCLLGWQLLDPSMDWPVPGFLDKHDKIAWLWRHPILTASILFVWIVLYVILRLCHMWLLYKKVAEAPAFSFVVQALHPRTGSMSPEVMWSVGDRVISEGELPVCQ
jgi:hypothetical protein